MLTFTAPVPDELSTEQNLVAWFVPGSFFFFLCFNRLAGKS